MKFSYSFGKKYRLNSLGKHLSYVYSQLKKDQNIVRVLDLGCGEGRLLAQNDRNFSIIGVDQDEEGLKIAKNRMHSGDTVFLQNINDKLSFENDFFDAVICWRVFHYFSHKKRNMLLGEISRILLNHGKLYLAVYSKSDWKFVQSNESVQSSDLIDCTKFYPSAINTDKIHFFSYSEIIDDLKAAGFEVVNIKEIQEKSGFSDVKNQNTYWMIEAVKK